MSKLTDFYRGDDNDARGRSLQRIWAWDDDFLEDVHDFIQWLFPLPEPSRFNPDAPLLTAADIAEFKSDPLMKANLRRSFERFLTFLGLTLAAEGRMSVGPNFANCVPDVWASPNHNWLRITRVLRSLTLLGLESEARAYFAWLNETCGSRRFPIGDDTYGYWSEAVRASVS